MIPGGVSHTDQCFRLHCIISGGQSGVDRAALDCSIAHGIEHGGWCPAGRLAEDGAIHLRYKLRETRTADYKERTQMNVQDSDGTLILSGKPLTGGTAITAGIAERLQKPLLVINPVNGNEISSAVSWLQINAIGILNIAGPRASKQPDIYFHAYHFLDRLLNYIQSDSNTR